MRGIAFATVMVAAALSTSCGNAKAPAASNDSAKAAPSTAVASSGDPGCPANGLWAECAVVYRLERAGLAPHVDSAATPNEKTLTGHVLAIKIGLNARLEVFLYPDSTARSTDAKKLDRTQLVAPGAPQTINRERTLIESVNLIGLLTSLNSHQRERVSDALLAGPPQPSKP